MIMNLTIALITEYIFDEQECITYLRLINVDPIKYEYIYKKYEIEDVISKKSVRRLYDVENFDLTNYTNLIELIFFDMFNHEITSLPNTLTTLIFGKHFNYKLPALPETLIHIKFDHDFNQPIMKLPSRLKYLEFGYLYNHKLPKIPPSLLTLMFGYCFNQILTRLPKNLQHLTLGGEYNWNISKFPHKLKELYIYRAKDFTLTQIPSQLTHLSVNDYYGKIKYLSSSITHLEWNCNQKLPELHYGITHLTLGHIFNQEIQCDLPISLKYLNMNYNAKHKFCILPSDLKYFRISRDDEEDYDEDDNDLNMDDPMTIDFLQKTRILPKGLHTLIWNSQYEIPQFPVGLKHLTICQNRFCIPDLPYGLTHFEMECESINDIEFPDTIIYLKLSSTFNNKISRLPSKLKHLMVGHRFNYKLPKLPDSLIYLELGVRYSYDITELPICLETLIVGCNIYLPTFTSWSERLKYLELQQCFNRHILYLPKRIKHVSINDDYIYKNELQKLFRQTKN